MGQCPHNSTLIKIYPLNIQGLSIHLATEHTYCMYMRTCTIYMPHLCTYVYIALHHRYSQTWLESHCLQHQPLYNNTHGRNRFNGLCTKCPDYNNNLVITAHFIGTKGVVNKFDSTLHTVSKLMHCNIKGSGKFLCASNSSSVTCIVLCYGSAGKIQIFVVWSVNGQ